MNLKSSLFLLLGLILQISAVSLLTGCTTSSDHDRSREYDNEYRTYPNGTYPDRHYQDRNYPNRTYPDTTYPRSNPY